MALLKTYGYTTETDSGEFEFTFEIPTNSNFNVAYDASKNIYTVSIQLNSGQSQPSNTYKTENYTFNDSNGLLNVNFQETLNGTTTKRPKMTNNENSVS